MKPVLSESRMRENRMSGSMSGNVETGLWLGYLGTVRRKGRKQRSQTYRYRATSRLYLSAQKLGKWSKCYRFAQYISISGEFAAINVISDPL